MRRSSSRSRFRRSVVASLSALVAALATASCTPEIGLDIALDVDDASLQGQIGFLKIVVRDLQKDAQPQVFTPIGLGDGSRLNTNLQERSTYYVDVFGCRAGTKCDGNDLILRGCTDVREVPVGEGVEAIAITMFATGSAGADACPPVTD